MKPYSNLRTAFFFFLLMGLMFSGMVSSPPTYASDQSVPLKGHFQGIGQQFAGNLTHLGHFQGVIDNSAEPATAIWTAANGDTIANQTISFDIDFSSPIGPNLYPYTQEIEITGGSGRFHSVIGHASVTGAINVATFEYDGQLWGQIMIPHSAHESKVSKGE